MAQFTLRAGVAACMLLAGVAGAAAAEQIDTSRNNGIPAQEDATPQTASGDRWAVVDGDASLARGKGVVNVKKGEIAGDYVVKFDRNVTSCVYVATVGLSGTKGISPPGFATVVRDSSNASSVYVSTYNPNGASAKRSFHLFVGCD